ncbi:MAG: RidA family protein [Saprospiraceae bacterium]|nr:RidA family protein [Saprospiraceae bacterium]
MRINPFPNDPDRAEIWNMLVERDIYAFCAGDWSMVEHDFIAEGFMGMDGGKIANPDQWKINYSNLELYRDEWLRQAEAFNNTAWKEDPVETFFALTDLTQIDIVNDTALAHKKFDGYLTDPNGEKVTLNWQTLYQCRKKEGKWKISGFVGYLPYPLGDQSKQNRKKRLPPGAKQHLTAGPYSPVLEIEAGKLVVISGQAAIDENGNVVGDQIEEQTIVTLENCKNQLSAAGCSLSDVFKVNVYLKNLDDWPRFNEIYATYFPDPKPVRTAVQTPLLMTLLVEVECWAVK